MTGHWNEETMYHIKSFIMKKIFFSIFLFSNNMESGCRGIPHKKKR